ncbi:MAG: hypothetical protein DRN11_04425 [Thermoplasmata archaeon]|nr:MAG: hypothetical protein DRN11_04425 [Thermoplasmata archaeon]
MAENKMINIIFVMNMGFFITFLYKGGFLFLMELLEELEKGIIVEIENVKQAISVDKIANAVLIRNFDLSLIEETIDAISLPVIASCRKGHFIEAKILEKVGVSIIDESNPSNLPYISKGEINLPIMRQINNLEEGEKMEEDIILRTKFGGIDEIAGLVKEIKEKLNTTIFASLKVASPVDIALLFQLDCDAIIISSMLFRSPNPPKLLDSITKAARYYNDIEKVLNFSKDIDKILPSEAK